MMSTQELAQKILEIAQKALEPGETFKKPMEHIYEMGHGLEEIVKLCQEEMKREDDQV